MRELHTRVDGKHYRGSWDTWEDGAWGRMVEVSYHDSCLARIPVRDDDPERVARRLLKWIVEEATQRHR